MIGKRVYLSSHKADEETTNVTKIIDLALPLHVMWKMKSFIKESEYLQTNEDLIIDVQDRYRHVFSLAKTWAVFEQDRLWLMQKSKALD